MSVETACRARKLPTGGPGRGDHEIDGADLRAASTHRLRSPPSALAGKLLDGEGAVRKSSGERLGHGGGADAVVRGRCEGVAELERCCALRAADAEREERRAEERGLEGAMNTCDVVLRFLFRLFGLVSRAAVPPPGFPRTRQGHGLHRAREEVFAAEIAGLQRPAPARRPAPRARASPARPARSRGRCEGLSPAARRRRRRTSPPRPRRAGAGRRRRGARRSARGAPRAPRPPAPRRSAPGQPRRPPARRSSRSRRGRRAASRGRRRARRRARARDSATAAAASNAQHRHDLLCRRELRTRRRRAAAGEDRGRPADGGQRRGRALRGDAPGDHRLGEPVAQARTRRWRPAGGSAATPRAKGGPRRTPRRRSPCPMPSAASAASRSAIASAPARTVASGTSPTPAALWRASTRTRSESRIGLSGVVLQRALRQEPVADEQMALVDRAARARKGRGDGDDGLCRPPARKGVRHRADVARRPSKSKVEQIL